MKTATFVRELGGGWRGEAALWRLSEPVAYEDVWERCDKKTSHVAVSALVTFYSFREPEFTTVIFPVNEKGAILGRVLDDRGRLQVWDCEGALRAIGYDPMNVAPWAACTKMRELRATGTAAWSSCPLYRVRDGQCWGTNGKPCQVERTWDSMGYAAVEVAR